jgi:hypothetical protein
MRSRPSSTTDNRHQPAYLTPPYPPTHTRHKTAMWRSGGLLGRAAGAAGTAGARGNAAAPLLLSSAVRRAPVVSSAAASSVAARGLASDMSLLSLSDLADNAGAKQAVRVCDSWRWAVWWRMGVECVAGFRVGARMKGGWLVVGVDRLPPLTHASLHRTHPTRPTRPPTPQHHTTPHIAEARGTRDRVGAGQDERAGHERAEEARERQHPPGL